MSDASFIIGWEIACPSFLKYAQPSCRMVVIGIPSMIHGLPAIGQQTHTYTAAQRSYGGSNAPLRWRVLASLVLFRELPRATIQERARNVSCAGAKRTYGAALGRGARGRRRPCTSGESRTRGAERERSASTLAMRM
eukprot:6187401-Pleurochrysis_carterae.AAC.1